MRAGIEISHLKKYMMKKKNKDRHLDTPAEANRDKHINFLALEAGDTDPADLPATGRLAQGNSGYDADESRQRRRNKRKQR